MKKILVIDDARYMRSFVEEFVPDVEVEQIYRLPEDESILAKYDGLIIDGSGISNSKYNNGLVFCKQYDKPEGQAVVFHSGNGVYGDDAKELGKRGIAIVPKGSNPEKLSLAARFAMEVKNDQENIYKEDENEAS